MNRQKATPLGEIFEKEQSWNLSSSGRRKPEKYTPKVTDYAEPSKPKTRQSLFKLESLKKSQYDESEKNRVVEKKKITIEEMNRNRRFLQSVFLKRSESARKKLHVQVEEDPSNQGNSMIAQIQEVSPQPLKRKKKQLKNRRNLETAVTMKKAKKGLFALLNFLKKSTRKDSQKFPLASFGSDLNYSFQRYKTIKLKHQKSLMIELHLGEQEHSSYESFFQQIKNEKSHNRFIILPDSNFRFIVDMISFIIIVYIAVQVPLQFSFIQNEENTSQNYLETIFDFWFLLELILNFMTAYFDKGYLIQDRRQIAVNYVKSWFLLDVICCFPFSAFYFSLQNSSTGTMNMIRVSKFAKYFRFLKMLKFNKANYLIQNIEELFITESSHFFAKFLKLFVLIFFLSHWQACFFFGIGMHDFASQGESWIISKGFQDDNAFSQYVNALYWAITTMTTVGMGDISPTTTNERLTGIFTVIVSSCLFGFIIQDIGKMVSSFNLLEKQFQEKILYVEQFMKNKQLPYAIRIQVRRYLDYCSEQKSVEKIDEEDMMGLLNEDLRCKLQVHLYGGIFARIKLLNSFSVELLSSLTFILVKQAYTLNEDLFVEGDRGSQIFYINQGKIAIIHKKTKTFIKDLNKKQYFGEVAFFTDLCRQASAKARDFSEVIVLDRKGFIEVARNICPESLAKLANICDGIDYEKKDFKSLQLRCYLCDVKGHLSIDCRQFEGTIKGNILRCYQQVNAKKIREKESSSSVNQFHQIIEEEDLPKDEDEGSLNESQTKKKRRQFNQQIKIEQIDKSGIKDNEPELSPELDEIHMRASRLFETQFEEETIPNQPKMAMKDFKLLNLQAVEDQSEQEQPENTKRLHFTKETGKKNTPRQSNWLTRQIAKQKRFVSVEKREQEKAQQPVQQGRIIKINEDCEQGDENGTTSNNIGQETIDNSPIKLPQVRNVFHPDYQDESDLERNLGLETQVLNNSPMHKVYAKLINKDHELSIQRQGLSVEKQKQTQLDLMMSKIQQQKRMSVCPPNHFQFQRMIQKNKHKSNSDKKKKYPYEPKYKSSAKVLESGSRIPNQQEKKKKPQNYKKSTQNARLAPEELKQHFNASHRSMPFRKKQPKNDDHEIGYHQYMKRAVELNVSDGSSVSSKRSVTKKLQFSPRENSDPLQSKEKNDSDLKIPGFGILQQATLLGQETITTRKKGILKHTGTAKAKVYPSIQQ